MVYNCYIKCQVCGKITRIRLQLGWLDEHPIVVTCGECGTSLSGKVKIRQDHPEFSFSFDNADIVNNLDANYMVECSGELPVIKQGVDMDPFQSPITPFLRTVDRMEYEAFKQFMETSASLMKTKARWSLYKRVLDLSKNKNNTYLIPEIHKIFDKKTMPCRNELEVLRAIHMIEILGFIEPLRKDLMNDMAFSIGILELDLKQNLQLVKFLNGTSGYSLSELQALVYKVLDEFVEVFPALIPALALQYYKDGYIDFEREGTTTSSFDSIKQFYLDVYEALGNLLIIPIALNNIKYRNDYNNLNSINGSPRSLEDYIGFSKAIRYKYCLNTEIYTDKLNIIVNSKLRNAIGHNDFEYDAASQKITYKPNPRDRSIKAEEYLLEFENEAIRLFQGVLVVDEYLYRLRELELLDNGCVPLK